MLDTIRGTANQHSGEDQDRRRELLTQLDRLQDLYVLGDLTKPRYIMRRQTLEEELQRLAPPADPDLDRAQELLGDFARFWRTEPNPAERRRLLTTLFDHIWQDNGQMWSSNHAQHSPRTSRQSTKPNRNHRTPTGNAG